MEFTGERFIPGKADEELAIEHFTRYRFAAQFAVGKRVLDAACGSGYGSKILAETAENVCGIDISSEAVAFANENYKAENISFQCASVAELPFQDQSFDLIVSFETLEHVDEQTQQAFLREIRRTLKPGGILVMSTPNREVYDKRGDNEFHVHELSYTEFESFLREAFRTVCFYPQMWEISNSIMNLETTRADAIGGVQVEKADYLIAICSDAEIEKINARVFVRGDGKYMQMLDWALDNHKNNEINVRRIAEVSEENERLTRKAENQTGHIEQLMESERRLSNINESQQGTIQSQTAHIEQLLESERRLSNLSESQQGTIRSQAAHIEQLLESERRLSDINESLQGTIQSKDQLIHQQEQRLQENDAALQQYQKDLNERDQQIQSLLQSEQGAKEQLAEKDAWIVERDNQIAYLSGSRQELEQIKGSRSWRFLGHAWKLRDVVIPKGSRRRLYGKMAVKMVKQPRRFLRLCTPQQAEAFFKTLRQNGTEAASQQLDNDLNQQALIGGYLPLSIPDRGKPIVSIIIPAYNQFDYTYRCIRSIIENSGEIAYEIILADDCSTDLTRFIRKIVSGLHIVRTRRNLRFLLNCNNAAKTARGKYILFLNNDTEVQKYWLSNLIDLIESADNIGMVGSKLVFADGKLQEAGGIIWRDGSGWNYGRGCDPNEPEFNYVKEVDYISGAAIMIRRSLWEEIGGFDERYAPAYCEDSDLAFEVRKHGYRVMYQPLSIVVHFEGVSNGTDLSGGLKAYQVENQKKFFEKWKDVLQIEHYPNACNVFQARDRSRHKKTVLFIDHYVPTYDKDAGSRTIFQYIKLLTRMGYHIIFIGDNFAVMQPYTCVLQQMGVEVLYGVYYRDNWEKWLSENGYALDIAFLNRPYVAKRYIDAVRELTDARIIYNVCDLAFLREQKEYEITGNPAKLKSAELSKEMELSMIQKADVSFTLSSDEKKVMEQYFPPEKSAIAPINIYFDLKEKLPERTKTEGLLFVGGFMHNPNTDACLWFCSKVLPKIIEKIPNVYIRIVGSYPPKEILDLSSQYVYVEGYVSDEKLTGFYQHSRICVIPLRFGGGVKGKTIEAMYNGIPIVTTSTGIEGLPDIQECIKPFDDAELFAQEVIRIYQQGDDGQTEKCYQYIKDHFSEEKVEEFFRQQFNDSRKEIDK